MGQGSLGVGPGGVEAVEMRALAAKVVERSGGMEGVCDMGSLISGISDFFGLLMGLEAKGFVATGEDAFEGAVDEEKGFCSWFVAGVLGAKMLFPRPPFGCFVSRALIFGFPSPALKVSLEGLLLSAFVPLKARTVPFFLRQGLFLQAKI